MKALLTLVFLTSGFAALAQSPGVVFLPDKAVPVVATPIWQDTELTFFRGTPSVDALLGYDARPGVEQMTIGYQVVLNWKITEKTQVYAGMAYLAPISEVRFDELWDKLGLAFGFRIEWR